MAQHGGNRFTGLSVTHVESALCAKRDRSNEWFGAVDKLVIGMPSKVVISVAVEIQ
jgi:hypothetical protein